jgi:CBS domain-containing protein
MQLARNLRVESVSRLRPTTLYTVAPNEAVGVVVALMRRAHVGCVLVCAGERLVGLFTERDLLRRVLAIGLPLTTPVRECMTEDPVVVRPKESIGAALRSMEQGGYRHLPVVDEAGLSVKRIVHYLVEHFPATIYNQPPDPNTYPHKAEGA